MLDLTHSLYNNSNRMNESPVECIDGIKQAINNGMKNINKAIEMIGDSDYITLLTIIDESLDNINSLWEFIKLKNDISHNIQWENAYEESIILANEFNSWLANETQLFERLTGIITNNNESTYSCALMNLYKGLIESGANISKENKSEFVFNEYSINKLQSRFEENIFEHMDNWYLHLENTEETVGIPDEILADAHHIANNNGLEGYIFTLDFSSYVAVMTYCECSSTRRKMYKGFVTCAANGDQQDNTQIIKDILLRRNNKAKYHGFENYADYKLYNSSFTTSDNVIKFIESLVYPFRVKSETKYKFMSCFAKKELNINKLEAYDIWYVNQKTNSTSLKGKSIDNDTESVYFPMKHVLKRMLELSDTLFHVKFEKIDSDDNGSVLYTVSHEEKDTGLLCFDLIRRDGKISGDSMRPLQCSRKTAEGSSQLAVAYVICNFDKKALLQHSQVITLFHEFGHAMHHLLSKSQFSITSGIYSLGEEFKELPSLFMEQLCWRPDVLLHLSSHYKTGETIPDLLLRRILNTRCSLDILDSLRQLEIALFDILSHRNVTKKSPNQIMKVARETCYVYSVPKYNKFQNQFRHIFTDGYDVNYFSYFWNEVLSVQAINQLNKNSQSFISKANEFKIRFLMSDGEQSVLNNFKEFCGEKPNINYYLDTRILKNNSCYI